MDKIHNAIIHLVPNYKVEAKINNYTIDLKDSDKEFLLKSINKAITSEFTLEINPILNGKDLVVREIDHIFTEKSVDQFIESTSEIARHLHSIQKGNISDGFLIFLVGSDDNKPALAILKLEPINGMIVNWEGDKILNIEVIKDLILNEKSSLYKFLYSKYYKGSISYKMMDDQRYSSDYPIANFWLFDFANSELIENDKTKTLDYYLFCNKFSNIPELPIEIPLRIKNALHARLNSEKPIFSISEFRENDVPKKYLSLFDDLAAKEKIELKTFRKDTTLIKKHLNKIILDFANQARLSYPYSENNKTVKYTNSKTEILSNVIKINGKNRN